MPSVVPGMEEPFAVDPGRGAALQERPWGPGRQGAVEKLLNQRQWT